MTCSASTIASLATLPLLCSVHAPTVLPMLLGHAGAPPAVEALSLGRVRGQPNRRPGTHSKRSRPSSPNENCQPDRRLIRRRPRHAVLFVGRDGDPISRPHLEHAVFKLQSGGTL
jgi:hypothetical protein